MEPGRDRQVAAEPLAAFIVQVGTMNAAARLNRLLRRLDRSPRFTVVAVVTLAVGTGVKAEG